MTYPAQIDCAWLAIDPQGHVAAMITGGSGPIPVAVLASQIDVTDIEDMLLDLPVVGEALGMDGTANTDGFAAFSRRGMFVYDWSDVHRPRSQSRSAYELVARPTLAINADELPPTLRTIAEMTSSTFGSASLRVEGLTPSD